MTDFKQEIKELLDSADSRVINQFFNRAVKDVDHAASCRWSDEETRSFFSEMMGKGIDFENVDSHGGEGEGEDYWSVYKFFKRGENPVFVKFQGWYQSYNGSEFDEWFFVEPKEVMVTRYVKVS